MSRPRRAADLAPLAWFALLFACSLARTGIGIYAANQQLQIPLVEKLNDPTLFPGDAFVDSLSHYAAALWWPVAWLARVVPLAALLTVLGAALRAFILWSMGRLAAAIAPGNFTALLAAWTWAALIPDPFIGEGTIVNWYFEQTGVAVACFALTAAAVIERRPRAFAVWLALTLNCNILYGLFALSYLVPCLLEPPYRAARKQWALALGAGMVLAFPSLLLARGATRELLRDRVLWLKALRAYYPYHFFPDSWSYSSIAKTALFFVLTISISFLLKKRDPLQWRRLVVWSAVAIGWLGACWLNAYVIRDPDFFILHPARGLDLFLVLATLSVAAALARELDESAGVRRWGCALALGLMLIGFYDSGRWLLLYMVGFAALQRWRPERAAAHARAALLVVVALSSSVVWVRRDAGVGSLVRRPDPALEEVAAWARRASARDAVFLVDPDWGEFRALAERQAFVTWKEGAAIMWQKNYVTTWDARLHALGVDLASLDIHSWSKLHDAFELLTAERVAELARAQRIDYWIVPREKMIDLPVAFENRRYKCLKTVHTP